MAIYTSKPVSVPVPIDTLFGKFSDLSQLQTLLDKLPQETREKIGDVSFTADSIKINTPQVGEISFIVMERQAPGKIVFGTDKSPVPLTLTAHLKSENADSTEVYAETDVQIPVFLKPMVGGMMQKATDQFGQLISQLGSAI